MYDFNARSYVASYPFFGRPDPRCTKFPWLNPYTFCGGDPINHSDPSGREIQGAKKKDAEMLADDFRAIFHEEEFSQFRQLIVRTGKKQNGKSLAPISQEALSDAFKGISLNEDQQALVDMTVNTINSTDKHIVEYIENTGNLSTQAEKAFGPKFDNPYLPLSTIINANGGIPIQMVMKNRGGGVTIPYKGGSYSLLSKDNSQHLYSIPVTVGHEVLGHGRSLALGRGEMNQHFDGIQTENLIRRVMGVTEFRDGTDHGDAGYSGFFPEHSQMPKFR